VIVDTTAGLAAGRTVGMRGLDGLPPSGPGRPVATQSIDRRMHVARRETEDEMRVRTLLIFGIGYMMGTRAGQDRYQQIVGSVRELAESDVVREYADRALDLARRTVDNTGAETGDDDGDIAGDDDETSTGTGRTKAPRSS
jgi:hypothetical protein